MNNIHLQARTDIDSCFVQGAQVIVACRTDDSMNRPFLHLGQLKVEVRKKVEEKFLMAGLMEREIQQ